MHIPVLLEEVIRFLDPKPGDTVIDGTVDGGGHARAIAERIAPGGTLLGVDWDQRMIEECRIETSGVKAVLTQGNYADLPEILKEKKLGTADALLLDLGFSSEQLEASGKGFSFAPPAGGEPLIMTYGANRAPVKELLKRVREDELAKIIKEFGGERFAYRIAQAIVKRRRERPVETSGDLTETIRHAVPKNYEHGRIHPATRTFQALRIWANDELNNLTRAVQSLPRILASGGRVVILTYHSLEDKIVKNNFREMEKAHMLTVRTKKPVTPSRDEVKKNPRSRSAKLRAAVVNPHTTAFRS